MTILESRATTTPTVFGPSTRRTAAFFLVLGPAVMLIGFVLSAIAERSAPGGDDLAVAVANPTWANLATTVDVLTPPTLIASTVVFLLLSRPWSRKIAWSAAIAMGLQACGLAVIVGTNLLASVLVQNGADSATIVDAMENLLNNPAGIATGILFFPTEIVGLVLLGVALWRTRWVPRAIPILFWVFPLVDMATPEHPKMIHVVGFTVFLAACSWLAAVVLRTGATTRPAEGHTQ